MSDASSSLYHGTRTALSPGEEIPPRDGVVLLTRDIDSAIWAAELAEGDAEPRVYRVGVTAAVEPREDEGNSAPSPHPVMELRSRGPVTVSDEVTQWVHYHGTRADLRPGDLIAPGHAANHGPTPRTANFVYFTRTLDAAIWGAELAVGDAPGRVYVVEPTGDFEDDPNLTDMRFRGNPTKSFRSRAPLRVVRELEGWTGHPPAVVEAMKDGLEKLRRAGVEPDDA